MAFKAVEIKKESRPKVAIFGDLCARNNAVFNQQLIRFIEKSRGMVITTPYSDYVKIIFPAYDNRLKKEGFYKKVYVRRFLLQTTMSLENK